MELMKEFRFEASHILPKHLGKCSRLHGHSWVLRVYVKGEINPDTGFVMDYGDIKKVVQPLVDALDHRHLGQWWGNEINIVNDCEDQGPAGKHSVEGLPVGFYPSSENLLMWIAGQLGPLDLWLMKRLNHPEELMHFLPGQIIPFEQREEIKKVVSWSKLELNETCTSAAILTREEYDNVQR